MYDGHWFHKLAAEKKRQAAFEKLQKPVESVSSSVSALGVSGTAVNQSASSLLKGFLKSNGGAGDGSGGIVVHDSADNLTGGVIGGVQCKVEGGSSVSDNSSKGSSLDKLRKLLQSSKTSNSTPTPAFVPTHVLTKQGSRPKGTLATSQDVRVCRQDVRTQQRQQHASVHNKALPVDAYREIILNKIRNDRVTIIHGETG
ncbi:hypothetical protein EON65_33715 [archaeon]|nr:MAG: hypothetical protein EON65_33715 [archaeon]